MKATGFIRKIDNLGRIVIPKEIRQKLKISEDSSLEIYLESSYIIIRKPTNLCTLCGSNTKLVKFKDKFLCNNCIDNIKKST